MVEVILPVLHEDQARAYLATRDPRADHDEAWAANSSRFKAIRCGRRWGKTELLKTISCDGAIKREIIGIFAPDYKRLTEVRQEIIETLLPVQKSASKTEGVVRTISNGRIDFWTLDDEDAGRSRKYHKVLVDEGAFGPDNMMDIWRKAIRPTLVDYRGSAYVLSNTNGDDPENFFWRICNQPEFGFIEYHAPSANNPFLPREELEDLKRREHPLVWRQEYLAEFVDWSGVAFFSLDKLLVDGQGVPYPQKCDSVFAVIDTAVKTGKDNDGTAVIYCARSQFLGHPLVVLDWDIVQIEGALLETWLPTVFQNLEALARKCGARTGSLGAWIEDKSSGSILLQQAQRRDWPAQPIESTLTAVGKDERAISVSGYVYRGEIKFSQVAYDKVVVYKGVSANHLRTQVVGFRVGDKNAAKRADDLLDCWCYAIAIAMGNAEGQ